MKGKEEDKKMGQVQCGKRHGGISFSMKTF